MRFLVTGVVHKHQSIATIGAVIAVAVIVTKNDSAQFSAGLGLAGTAIAGAAGLAQSSKSEPDFSVSKQGDNLKIETPSPESADRK